MLPDVAAAGHLASEYAVDAANIKASSSPVIKYCYVNVAIKAVLRKYHLRNLEWHL